MDLSVYTGGANYDIEEYDGAKWFMENYTKYGYILRYPESKASVTRIDYEGWHYRYVGLPHSLIMEKLDLCLEEYIEDYLPFHTAESAVLSGADGKLSTVNAYEYELKDGEWAVYYVPASAEGDTGIPVPFDNYTVSGDNVAGFIVTAH